MVAGDDNGDRPSAVATDGNSDNMMKEMIKVACQQEMVMLYGIIMFWGPDSKKR